VRIAAHRPVKERHLGPVLLQLLDQKRLMHEVARQPVRLGDQDAVQPGTRSHVAQAVEARPLQAGAAVAVVAEHAICRHAPPLALGMGTQAVELLVSRLRLGLALRRHSGVNGYVHGGSPPVCPSEDRRRERPNLGAATPGAAGRLGPTAAPPRDG